MSQNVLRAFLTGPIRARAVLQRNPMNLTPRRLSHDEGPPQPFDNMPFSIPNRFVATAFFAVFFGIGLWAPMIIVWYSMAKRTL